MIFAEITGINLNYLQNNESTLIQKLITEHKKFSLFC